MSRGTWIAVGALALGVAVLALLGRGGAQQVGRDLLQEGCAELLPGDSLESVLERLGPAGFRPGCGTKLPCEDVVAAGVTFRLSCADDCSQLWRLDGFSCFVDFDPGTRALISSEGAEGRF